MSKQHFCSVSSLSVRDAYRRSHQISANGNERPSQSNSIDTWPMFPSQAENIATIAGRRVGDRNYERMLPDDELFVDENGGIIIVHKSMRQYREIYRAYGVDLRNAG